MNFFIAMYSFLNFRYSKFVYYILPNKLKFNRTKTLISNRFPHLQQKLFTTGKGIIKIGNDCSFGYVLGGFYYGGSIELQVRYKDSRIYIGNNVFTNNNISIISANKISIGTDSLIGQNVCIMDFDAHGISPNERRILGKIGEVEICNNVWIGNNVTILKDTFIGKNTIIAAGAVVSGRFPSNVIIGGVPAKIIKKIVNV